MLGGFSGKQSLQWPTSSALDVGLPGAGAKGGGLQMETQDELPEPSVPAGQP